MAGLKGQHWLIPDWDPRLTIAQLSLPHLTAHGLRAAVIDVDPETSRIYLHILHAERAEATAEHVQELADLACCALPMPTDSEVPS